MQIPSKLRLPEPQDKRERDLQYALTNFSRFLIDLLNGGLRFADNFDAEIKSITTNGTANTEDAVSHSLKRVPTGYLILNRDKAGVVYDSGTPWTATSIYLKCSVATVAVKIMIF